MYCKLIPGFFLDPGLPQQVCGGHHAQEYDSVETKCVNSLIFDLLT